MRRFLVESVLGAVVLLTVALVLSLISVPQPFPFGTRWAPILVPGAVGVAGYLAAGVVLAVVNRFVRPLIVALTGRFLLSTLGLFVVVINAIMLWVGSLFAPDLGTLANPFILWFVVVAALYTALSALASAVLGLNRPHLQAAEGNRDLWRMLESLPTPRRNVIIENLRLKQVYDMIYATALDSWLANTPLGPVRQWFTRVVLKEEEPESATGAEQLRLLFQRLGPTYVKIGQMMASRADVLPPDIVAELSKLQSEASPFPWDEARVVIEGELGKPPEELFASIETEPFAAASTAQVHRATLADGTARRRQGSAAPDRRQDEGRPRRHVRARGDLRAAACPRPQGRRPGDGRRVRRRRPQGARLPERGLPREAPRRQHGPLPGDPGPRHLR